MNTFKRKAAYVVMAALMLMVAACGSAEKRYQQLVQDTNDRIERVHKAESEADAKLAEALSTAAQQQPALVAAVASNVMMARALKGGGASSAAFVVPQPPKSTSEEVRAWLGIIVPTLVQGYGMNRSAAVQIRQSDNDYLRYVAGQEGETSRMGLVTNMGIQTHPTITTTTTNTNTFGRDGNVGNGTQQNNNSTTTNCTAGNGANGGPGGNGGNGGGTTGPGAPGAAGAAGGPGGNAC